MSGIGAGNAVEATLDQRQLVEVAFSSRQLAGVEPHAIEFRRSDVTVAPAELLPADSAIVASFRRHFDIVVHAESPRGSIRIEIDSTQTIVTVTSSNLDHCGELADEMSRRCRQAAEDDIALNIWRLRGSGGVTRHRRHISPLPWGQIRRNYPARVARRLDQLMTRMPPATGGRLIVFHGEPGTGKTHALRALLDHWRSWCAFDLISEPEVCLANANALERIIAEGPLKVLRVARLTESAVREHEWRLVIAEDADEMLRASNGSGGLGPLLSITDGLVGQGSRTMFLLTTNEPITELPPALTRPGRCLAHIEFERFSAEASRAWLGAPSAAAVSGPMTIAELYERRFVATPRQRPGSDGSYL